MKSSILRKPFLLALLGSAFLANTLPLTAQTNTWVNVGTDGKLVYKTTAKGDKVPDYSGVGYRNSEEEIPDLLSTLPADRIITIATGSGDRAPAIRSAIVTLKTKTLLNGFRGVIKFNAGTYEVATTVVIDASGIVLIGAGSGSGGTVINYTYTAGENTNCFFFRGPNVSGQNYSIGYGTARRIQGSYVPFGSKTVTLASGHGLQAGQWVGLRVQYNQTWINMLGMNQLDPGEDWETSDTKYTAEREVKAVNGNVITLDAPVMDPIDSRYAVGDLLPVTADSRIENCGIANMRINAVYTNTTNLNHGYSAVAFENAKHGWAKNIFAYYFAYACVNIDDDEAAFITVEDCLYSEPRGPEETGIRYSFNIDGQRSLVQNCRSEKGGRHDFVSGSWTPGPSVFYNCTATDSLSDSGPHHRYTTGHLYDRVKTNYAIRVQNRESMGTGHGWAGAQIMLWNCEDTDGTNTSADNGNRVQDIPGDSTNFAIGFKGDVVGGNGYPQGIVESEGTHITAIPSLFLAQLNDRLALEAGAPAFSAPGGTYSSSVSVSITSSTSGATIRYTTDGSTPTNTTGTVYSGPLTISSTTTLKAIAYATGFTNSTVTTATYTITVPPGGVTVSPSQPFYNQALPSSQSGIFEAQFDATPSATDATIGLCLGNQSAYTGLAVIVRFATTGAIDARNGGAYAAANTIPYTTGATYRFRLVVNVPAHTFSAYVKPAGGSEIAIGTNYAFRTEQASVTSLNTMNIDTNNGPITVGPVTITANPLPTPAWTYAGPTTFNGTNFINGTTATGSSANLSVAFWATPSAAANMGPVDKLPETGTSGWSVKLRADGALWFRIGSEATRTDVIEAGVYSANTPVHIVCTFGAGTAKIYVNGVERASQSGITAYTTANTTTTLRLGIPSVAATSNVYTGVLQKVNIYHQVLTAAQVAALYQQ
jgi:hypothetical protein